MMDPQAIFDIGKRNYLALRKMLWKAGILLAGEAVGGGKFTHRPAGDRQRQALVAGRREAEGTGALLPAERRNPWPTGS